MKKKLLSGLVIGLLLFAITGIAKADSVTLVDQGSEWQYSVLTTDLYSDWSSADHDSVTWNSLSWSTGKAAFGNTNYYNGSSLTYNTSWAANSDLALQKSFYLTGTLEEPITLNVASDNGFIVFINGHQVAKDNLEGYTFYWEYTLPVGKGSFISPGNNVIQVLAEDHGGITFFDLKLTGSGNVSVPEPATMLLLGLGLVGLAGVGRKLKK